MSYKIINRKKRSAVKLADKAGRILFSIIQNRKIKSHHHFSKIKKILIIRTAYLGDILMTVPILKPLKEKWPESHITFVCSGQGAELIEKNPYIDRIEKLNPFWFYKSSFSQYLDFVRRMRRENFDVIIEARGDIREIFLLTAVLKAKSKVSYGFGGGSYLLTHTVPFTATKHRVEYHLDMVRYLGCRVKTVDQRIFLSEQEYKAVEQLLGYYEITPPFAAVHPGARLPLKRWYPEKFVEVSNRIMSYYRIPVVILGAPEEKKLAHAVAEELSPLHVNLAGKLNLRQVAALLSKSALFLCNDSAPMHMASAMNTPTVAIFGPSKSLETAPYSAFSRVVEKDFPCRYSCDESHCYNPEHHGCMKAIESGDVFEKVRQILG